MQATRTRRVILVKFGCQAPIIACLLWAALSRSCRYVRPYGEIAHLTNYSRDWAIMKFELRVPFETDINMLRKIIKKVGVAMMEDPELGPDMLEPLKSQGVNRMDDSALIIRCKFTAKPGKQFVIRREAFTRIQKAFEEKGIKFAPRRVLVESVTPTTAVAAAAAGAMDQELPATTGSSDRG